MVNAELVRLGLAQASSYPPDTKYQKMFQELQQQAKVAGIGLWANPPPGNNNSTVTYIGNKSSKKFHISTCRSVSDMKESNKIVFTTRAEAISQGYVPCKICTP